MNTCKYCGKKIKNIQVKCKSDACRKAYARDYYHEKVKSSYVAPVIKQDPEMIAAELNGLLPIESRGGLFEGCSPEQIKAMQTGNFKEFIEL